MKTQSITRYFLVLFLMVFQMSFGQIEDDSFDPAAESVRLAPTPTSPEAQAFTKYGNTPVNMYTGTPSIQIPIYTHKGRELDLPISLTYDASGIKVEQLATNVGLGWNLNVGGRVTRITNGMPDDFSLTSHTFGAYKSFWDSEVNSGIITYADLSPTPTFSTQQKVIDYLNFLRKTNDNEYDTQPDYYSFSALGNNDMIVIDVASKTPKALNNPRVKVSFYKPFPFADSPIENWVVTMDDGTIYTFEEAEVTQDTNLNDTGPNTFFGFKKEFNSSWLLTKIESPNSKDIYEFIYTDLGFWTSNNPASNISGVTNVVAVEQGLPQSMPTATNPMGYNSTEYKIRQKVLSQITHNGERIVDLSLLADRWDMTVDSAIEKINIYDQDTSNPTADLYKSFVFNYDYFRTANAKLPPYHSGNIPLLGNVRLKLDRIDIKDSNSSIVKDYAFEYLGPYSMASTGSKAQDYYGYYNGINNSVLYPTSNEPAVPSNGANRNPSFNNAKTGLLNKITYPTGGHTEFEYEANFEKELTGYTTTWQTVGFTQLSPVSLPSLNPFTCNASFLAGDQTPETIGDAVFEVTQNQTDYKMIYDQTGTLKKGYHVEHMASLVKIPSLGATLSWSDIYDNNCNVKAGVNVVWDRDVIWVSGVTPIYPSTTTITLDSGFYQLVLANPSITLSNSFEVKEGVQVANYVYNEKAGVRVKSIKDYTDATTLAFHKTYEYPSGTVISMPDYDYYSLQYSNENNQPKVSTILHRVSYASGTDKPHIGYAEVIEKTEDVLGSDSNGTTSHRFYTNNAGNYRAGVYTYYINGKETAKQYGVTYNLGKSSGNTVYDSQGVPVSSSSNSYYDLEYYSNSGLYLNTDENKSDLYPIPTYNSFAQNWYISLVNPAGYNQNLTLIPPSECNTTNFITSSDLAYLCNPGIARLVKRTTNAWGKAGNITTSSSSQYYNAAADIVSQIINYTYYDDGAGGDPQNYLLKEKSSTNSENETIKQELFYPDNFSSEYSALRTANMLSVPVETKFYRNTNLISDKKTSFNGTIPDKIKVAKSTQSLEDRLLFERFVDDNLVQVKQVNGPTTAYIWGYDKRYVIAKVENATYTQIEALGAFSSFPTTGGLTTSQKTALRGMTNVLVTTYDYDPLVGVTTITDPRGNTLTYEYDDFHRLKKVKDRDDKVLSENKYNYGPQN